MERLKKLSALWSFLGLFIAGFSVFAVTSPEDSPVGAFSRRAIVACLVIALVALFSDRLQRFSEHLGVEIRRFAWLWLGVLLLACLMVGGYLCFIRSIPCPDRTILRWIGPTEAVVDGNVLKPGKEIWMEEVYNDNIGPKYFEVYEVYSPVFDELINRSGGLRPIAPFDVKKRQPCIKRSDHPWSVSPPSGSRGQSTFRFKDDRGNWSGEITSTNLWKAHVEMPIEFEVHPGISQVKGEGKIEGEIILASDPEVCLVLMVPWGEGEGSLEDYLSEYLEYLQEFNPDIPDVFVELFGEYLPSEPPEGWEFMVSPETIEAYPWGPERARFVVRLATPTLGKTLLAVKAIDCGDPSRFVVSEIIGIEGAPY